MARRKGQLESATGEVSSSTGSCALLTLSGSASESARAILAAYSASLVVVNAVSELLEASADADVLVLHAKDDCPKLREAMLTVRKHRPSVACVAWCDDATLEFASFCLQHGAADLLTKATSDRDITQRLAKARGRTLNSRTKRKQQAQRAKDLRETSQQLACVRQELEQQMGAVAGQLAGSFRDMASHLRFVALASELDTLLRQELEVEPLLRTTLEFLLRKIGAVNAAIFLPDDQGDYGLGAYVNYDFPRETAQDTLEDLGSLLAPMFESRQGLHTIEDAGAIPQRIDPDLGAIPGTPIGWLADTTLGVFTCTSDDGCCALLTIFRDKRSQFDQATLRTLTIIGDLFGRQLVRMVKTTNRAAQKSEWDVSGEAA